MTPHETDTAPSGRKHAGLAFLLTLLLGPLGLAYATRRGALVMAVPGALLAWLILANGAVPGLVFLAVLYWALCIAWGVGATSPAGTPAHPAHGTHGMHHAGALGAAAVHTDAAHGAMDVGGGMGGGDGGGGTM